MYNSMYSGYPGYSGSAGYSGSGSYYPSASSNYYNNYYNQMGSDCTGAGCGEAQEAQPEPEVQAAPAPAPEPVAQPQQAINLPEMMPDYDMYADMEEQQKKEELDWLWIELLASKIKENMKKQQQENVMGGKRNFQVCPAVDDLLHPVQLAHPTECHNFYVCSQGTPVEIECPNQLAYDTETERCVVSDICN